MDLVTIALSVVYIITLFYTTFWLITLLEVKEEKKKHLKKFPFISVLVPAYNEEDNIIETLNSLVSLDYPSIILSKPLILLFLLIILPIN